MKRLSIVGGFPRLLLAVSYTLLWATCPSFAQVPTQIVPDGSLGTNVSRVNIVNVSSPGEVVVEDSGTYASSFEQLGDITVQKASVIDVGGDAGGTVYIRGGRLVVDNSFVFGDTLGDADGACRTQR